MCLRGRDDDRLGFSALQYGEIQRKLEKLRINRSDFFRICRNWLFPSRISALEAFSTQGAVQIRTPLLRLIDNYRCRFPHGKPWRLVQQQIQLDKQIVVGSRSSWPSGCSRRCNSDTFRLPRFWRSVRRAYIIDPLPAVGHGQPVTLTPTDAGSSRHPASSQPAPHNFIVAVEVGC